ncbi:MAG: site-specific DNA-methyltransferase [Chloroflexota bacterium]|nr:site-specific DNA-methyltransferase [Chloroflexota bacterium]
MAKEQSNDQHSTSNISYLMQMSEIDTPYKKTGVSQPKAEYARNKELPYFFGQPMLKGTYHPINSAQRKILLASSNPGDTVIDPFLGSGTTAVVAEQLKRNWKGCDISVEYAGWAAKRIELVEDWPLEKWLQYDSDNARRRKSIRYRRSLGVLT